MVVPVLATRTEDFESMTWQVDIKRNEYADLNMADIRHFPFEIKPFACKLGFGKHLLSKNKSYVELRREVKFKGNDNYPLVIESLSQRNHNLK